jgi:secreted trypsin-like serine protease
MSGRSWYEGVEMTALGGRFFRSKLCVAAAFGFALMSAATVTLAAESAIVGGNAAPPGKWPFQVALLRTGFGSNYASEWCGGSLVDKFHVVTAAHCVFQKQPANFRVLTGTQSLVSGGTRHAIASIKIHPSYNNNRVDYDIAVITLKTPAADIAFFAELITTAQEQTRAAPGTMSFVTGWGSTIATGGGYPRPLYQVQVPLVSSTDCNDANSYGGEVTPRMICAGLTQGGKDSCDGDSGGPLVVKDAQGGWRLQAGIVSWGDGCARKNKFGVYSRVAVLSAWAKMVIAADGALVARLDCERLAGQGRQSCLQRRAASELTD